MDKSRPHSRPIALGYGRDANSRLARGLLLCVATAIVAAVLIAGYLRTHARRTRAAAGRHLVLDAGCSWQLREIGHAIAVHAASHGGRFPHRLEELTSAGMPRGKLLCPVGARVGRASVRPDTNVIDAYSYIYVGDQLTAEARPDAVVAYERLENHGTGANILFADGHVEWFGRDEAAAIVDRARGGKGQGGKGVTTD